MYGYCADFCVEISAIGLPPPRPCNQVSTIIPYCYLPNFRHYLLYWQIIHVPVRSKEGVHALTHDLDTDLARHSFSLQGPLSHDYAFQYFYGL